MPALMGAYSWTCAAWIAGGICAIGLAACACMGFALSGDFLNDYAPTVHPGEAMILVQCAPHDARRLSNLLQERETGKPVLFVIRPYLLELLDEGRRDRKLLSTEQLRLHAAAFAASQNPGPQLKLRKSIPSVLSSLEATIDIVRHDLAEAVELNQSITPSAEWLLDNAYIIQNHIHDIRRNLPKRYHAILPTLTSANEGVKLRILQLVLELVNNTDGSVSSVSIHNFLSAYQECTSSAQVGHTGFKIKRHFTPKLTRQV